MKPKPYFLHLDYMSKQTYLVFLLFAVLVALFYGNTLRNGFIFDDRVNIEKNEYLRSFQYVHKIVTGCLPEFVDKGCKGSLYPYYRPVFSLSSFLIYQVSSHPWIFHLWNLFYFFLGASLVFLFIQMVTKNFLTALLGGLFFVIHPIQSSVVNWVSAVPELTVVIFTTVTLILYLRYRETNSLRRLLLVYAGYFFAISSKEPAMFLPFMLFFLDLLILKKSIKELLRIPELKRYFLFAIPLAGYLFLKFSVMGVVLGGNGSPFTLWEGIHARVTLFAQYVKTMVYPYPLSIFHPFEKSSDFLHFDFLVSLVIVAGFFIALFMLLKKGKNRIAFSLLWFVFFLSPALIFLIGEPDHMLSERLVFLPGIGFSLIAAQVFSYGLSYSRITKYVALSALALSMIISWLIVFPRNTDWKNEQVMYEATLRRYPDAHEIRRNVGELYLRQGELEKAKTEFQEIIRRDEDWKDITMAYKGLGDYWRAKGERENAVVYYEKAIETGNDPRDYVTYNDLGVLYMGKNQYLKGFGAFCKALQLYGQSEIAQKNFSDASSIIEQEYISKGFLAVKVLEELEKSPDQKVVFKEKQCNEKVCQYLFSFQTNQPEALPPFLISAALPNAKPVEITSKSFDPSSSTIILETPAIAKNQTLTFLFPTCHGTYYEATTLYSP